MQVGEKPKKENKEKEVKSLNHLSKAWLLIRDRININQILVPLH